MIIIINNIVIIMIIIIFHNPLLISSVSLQRSLYEIASVDCVNHACVDRQRPLGVSKSCIIIIICSCATDL